MGNAEAPQKTIRFQPEPARWERISRELLSWSARCLQQPVWDEADLRTATLAGFAQGIGPYLDFLYRSSPHLDQLPAEFRAALARQRESSRQRSQRILSEAARILDALHQAQIPAIPLKGIVVASLVYPSFHVRPMADLDLLVPARHLDDAGRIMASLGYEAAGQTWKHLTFIHPQNRTVVDDTVEHPDNPFPVEVHSRCAQFFCGLTCDLTARLWDMALPGPFLGTETMLVPLAEVLLTVAVHASANILTHRARLVHLLDVAHLAQTITTRGEWPAVLDSWDRSLLRFAYPAIGLTAALLPDCIPGDVLLQMQRQMPHRLVEWAADGDVFFTLTHFGGAPRDLNALGFMPRLARHPLEAVQMGVNSLLPPRWYLAERFPEWSHSRWLALGYLWINLQRLARVRCNGSQ